MIEYLWILPILVLAILLVVAFIFNNMASPNFSDSIKSIESIVNSIEKIIEKLTRKK